MNVLGSIVPPADIGEAQNMYNTIALLEMLNSGECFDIDLDLKEKDILELHFTVNEIKREDTPFSTEVGYLVYAFEIRSGKWGEKEYDPFGNNQEFVLGRKIGHPFQ